MKVYKFGDKEYWTVTKPSDLEGWVIVGIEDWKPGVKRLHVRTAAWKTPVEFRMLYCPERFIAKAQPQDTENLT